jgi:hypothetical protein
VPLATFVSVVPSLASMIAPFGVTVPPLV